jgi:WD40 repeat protein
MIISVAFKGETCLTGAASGVVHMWNGTGIGKSIKNHTAPVDALTVTSTHIFTGGRDNKICVLDASTMALSFTIDCSQFVDSVNSLPRAIAISPDSNYLYVGTFGSEIWRLNLNLAKKTATNPEVLIQGHFSPLKRDNNEAWGMAVMRNKPQYLTVGDDMTLRIWNYEDHAQVDWVDLKVAENGKSVPLDPKTNEPKHGAKGRSVDVNPSGTKIAIGMRDGSLRIYAVMQTEIKLIYLKQVSQQKASLMQAGIEEWIEDLKFSPDGSKLVVGSHDNFLYLFDMSGQQPTLLRKFGNSSSFITHIDWSLDSKFIRTQDGSYFILYYDVDTGKQIPGGAS